MSSQGCDHKGYGIHFFKVILESSIRNGELRVPRSFVMRHWQGISNPVSLRLPNSTEWKVYWMKRDGDVWFRNGWKEFAQYLSLDVSQFVVFRYEENSHFNVIIFDKSALEIKYPSRVADETDEEVDDSDYSLKILEDCSPFEVKSEKSRSPSSRTHKKMKINPKEEQADAGFDNAKHMDSGSRGDIKERIKTFHEKVKKNFRSENDFFTCAIQKTSTERDILIIPNEFSKSKLHKKEGNATLFVNKERTWNVELKLLVNGQLAITRGWKNFLVDNNLKLGDVCAFVLNKGKGVSFKVVIFALEEDSSTLLFKDKEGLSHKPSSFLKTPETPQANRRLMLKNDFIFYVKPPLHLATIPVNFVRSNLTHGRYATLQVGKRSWPVKVLYYEYASCVKFSRGWHDFVRDCNLKVGDACQCKMVDQENFVIQVSISRRTR